MDTEGITYITEQDINDNCMWVLHQDDDLFYPVYGPDDLPADMKLSDLATRAVFMTPSGTEFRGYIFGLKNIYCVVIFFKNEMFIFNKNLLSDCEESIQRINTFLNKKVKVNDFFPLKYETNIDIKNFNTITGEFDIFKHTTDEEKING